MSMSATRFTFISLALSATFLSASLTTASAATIYVDRDAVGLNNGMSWDHAFSEVYLALAAAQEGDEIWVAEGTYKPGPFISPDPTISLHLVNQVGLYGGFAGNETSRSQRDVDANITILSGDLLGDDGLNYENTSDNVQAVVRATSAITDWAVLDGFMITAGVADYNPAISDRCGGLRASGATNLTTANCTFVHNWANVGGGAGYINSTGTMSDCLFIDNYSRWEGGAFIAQSTSVTVERCTFEDNYAYFDEGGAVFAFGSSSTPTFIDCLFKDNHAAQDLGGAFYVREGANATIIRSTFLNNRSGTDGGALGVSSDSGATALYCRFLGNQADDDGGAVIAANSNSSYTVDLLNCLFSGNTSGGDGGALYCSNGDLVSINNTLSRNDASGVGGGIFLGTTGVADVDNSICWDNSDSNGTNENSQILADGTLSIDFSCVMGWTGSFGGQGNNGGNPRFVDPDGNDDTVGTSDDNLRLDLASSCLNSGDKQALPADVFDIDSDGNTTEPIPFDLDWTDRVKNNRVEKGAYELKIPRNWYLTGRNQIPNGWKQPR